MFCAGDSFGILFIFFLFYFLIEYNLNVYFAQAIRLELLPPGERAPQQLWTVPRGARHLHRADGLQRPGAAGEDDGPGGWCEASQKVLACLGAPAAQLVDRVSYQQG